MEISARLAAPLPISLAEALSAAGMSGYGERAHTAGVQTYGALLFGLQAFLRPDEVIQLHKVDLIGAKNGVLDSWSLMMCPPGLRMVQLDDPAMAISEPCYGGPQTVAFGTRGVWDTVPASCIRTVHQSQCRTRERCVWPSLADSHCSYGHNTSYIKSSKTLKRFTP